jgi:carbamoylphosphate synthase large subunit
MRIEKVVVEESVGGWAVDVMMVMADEGGD